MKKAFILTIATLFLLTACQATPEAPVVIQKDMEQMIEKAASAPDALEAAASSLREQTQTPDAVQYSDTAYERLRIEVDTVVTVPDATAMPILLSLIHISEPTRH